MSENQSIELDAGTPEIDLSQISKRSVTGIIATSSVVTLLLARRHIVFNIFSSLKSSILSSLALGVALFFISSHVNNLPRLIGSIVLGGLVYSTFIFIIEGKDFVKKTFNYFKIKA